jgi:uncharacterized protein HemY
MIEMAIRVVVLVATAISLTSVVSLGIRYARWFHERGYYDDARTTIVQMSALVALCLLLGAFTIYDILIHM